VLLRVWVKQFLIRKLIKSTFMSKNMIKADGLGDRLREERDRLGLNQTDFGLLLGVSRGTQKAYELGSGAPDIRYIAALEERGVDSIYVLSGQRATHSDDGLSFVEERLIEKYRSLTEADQQSVQRIVGAMADVPSR
jgi:transcriptional regulator with XRE-family HTH domain